MKKSFFVVFVLIISTFLYSSDFMKPAQSVVEHNYSGTRSGVRLLNREQDPAPEYSFILNGNGDPTTFLNFSYWDYMPFSYNGHNIRIQPEISMPYGYQAGGIYITYMFSQTSYLYTDRKAYFSYLDEYGTSYCSDPINNNSTIREGFTSCAIDPYTADPFSVWHSITEPDGSYDTNMSYYLYHAGAQYWRQPFILIDNPEISEPYTGHSNDEFIWPQVHIGPSPEIGHRRVHVYGNNFTNNSAGRGNYNCIYLYADFDDLDLLATSDLDWTVQSIPYFDIMHYDNIARVNKDIIVSEIDGKVAFFGSLADSLFALYSNDYGETFTKYTQQLKQPLQNPTNNVTGEYVWYNDDDITPSEMFILPSNDLNHYNGIFTEEYTKVQWMSGVNYNSQEKIDNRQYMPQYMYPKIFSFDTDTAEFSFYDLDVQDSDPADNHLAVAFDLNDNGEVDEYDEDGWPIIAMSCPSWYFGFSSGWQDAYFHENNCKMTSNGNWIVCVWHDGAKLQNAYFEVQGYEGWVKQPEIAIVISDDNGETWSDIRYINANINDAIIDSTNHYDGNYAPELDGMLPVNIALGDQLEILDNESGNYHAKLHIAFFDDISYGSEAGAQGPMPDGGSLHYAAIDLEFQNGWIDPVSVDPEILPELDVKINNYPNPFNPSTTISFSIPSESKVNLSIYNIKGQKVRTFLISSSIDQPINSVTWNGTDQNNQPVSSGIYFYKLKSGEIEVSRKMLLLK